MLLPGRLALLLLVLPTLAFCTSEEGLVRQTIRIAREQPTLSEGAIIDAIEHQFL